MKLLIHNVAGGYGGSERTIECLLPHLQPKMEIWVAGQNRQFLSKIKNISDTTPLTLVQPIQGRTLWDITFGALKTIILCRKMAFDVVITNSNKSALIIAISRIFIPKNTKIIVFVRDFQWLNANFIFSALGNRAQYFAPSGAVSELWPKSYGARKVLSYNPATIEPSSGILNILPDCIDIDSKSCDRPTGKQLLVLGSIVGWKGIDTVIRAISLLVHDHPDVSLIIAGNIVDHKLFANLQALSKQLKITQQVSFVSYLEDINTAIQKSQCIISASLPSEGGPETFGRTIIEAWGNLRPVIATRCGGPKYLIQDRVDGILFEPGNHIELAKTIQEILENPEFAWNLALNGRRKFENNYTTRKVAQQLINIISPQSI